MDNKIFIGNIINPSNKENSVDVIEDGFIIVTGKKIVSVGQKNELEKAKKVLPNACCAKIITLTKTQFLIPGLIDTHIHAPQYPNSGLGYDVPLLEWLNKYTYKLESKYSDLAFSKNVYDAVVKKTLSFGTTTACYFGSLYANSSLVLVDSVIKYGQRAFVGKINMIRLAPPNYIETAEESITNTETFVKAVLDKKNELVKPVITPRFALSLDMDVMKKLGDIAKKYDLNVQTHISENLDEIKMVKDLFSNTSYAQVYNEANLLTKKTVLAHGVHLNTEEMTLLAEKGTSISHCPSSNTRLKSGLCNVRLLQKNGINVGLGTDVSGGAFASIIDAMRSAIDTSIHLEQVTKQKQHITAPEAFYLATIGGAKALAIEDKVGSLEVGKDFDALIVDMNVEDSSADLIGDYNVFELFEKFVYLGDDRNVKNVFVAGQKVK